MNKGQKEEFIFELKDLQKTRERIDGNIWRIAKTLNPSLMPWHVISSLWDCKKSPIGRCIYDNVEDRYHDNCLFCGEPEERK